MPKLKEDSLEELSIEGIIMSKHVSKTQQEVVEWLRMAQDRDRCQAVVNMVTERAFPLNGG